MSSKSTSAAEIAADYTVSPEGLGEILKRMIRIRQPVMVWGAPGVGKSQVSAAVAASMEHDYHDIRALLLDPVDLRGVPHITDEGRTRWASPEFLPASDSDKGHVLNLEELPAAPHMVQAALYQLVLDRKIGEYRLPDGAALIACGNRVSDRGVSHRMVTPLASRFVHVDVEVDSGQWCKWAMGAGFEPEVLFFIQMRDELLHRFDPKAEELAFPCPRTWEFVSRIVADQQTSPMDPALERAIYRGAVGEAAAVEFCAFLRVWRELDHPNVILSDPTGCRIPSNASALIAMCGSLTRFVDDTHMDALVTFAGRLRPELGEFLVGACVRRDPTLQYTKAYTGWVTAQQ